MSDKTRLFLLTTFFILALIWNILIPAYENLDEIEHSEVVRHLVVAGELPVHGEAEEKGFHVRQEASQPPLYYILAASWARFWKLPTDPPTATPIPETLVACGPSSTFYNKATWARDPYQDGPPWKGADLWLHGLRIFSSLLQIVTLTGTWALARRAFPRGPVPLLATAIVAFNPQFLLVSAGVNNDNLITPLATWALVLAYDLWDKGPNYQRLIGFGTLAGLAASSKLSGLGLLGLGGLIALAWTRKHIGKSAPPAPLLPRSPAPSRPRFLAPLLSLLRWGLLMAIPAFVLMLPWVRRNMLLYNDPTALTPMLELVGQRAGSISWGEAWLTFRSYWGQLPCSFYPRALYWPYYGLLTGGIVGLITGWRKFTPRQRTALYIAMLWFAIIVAAWVRWNMITPATGGRLLFPAAPALALVIAAGWQSKRAREQRSRGVREQGSEETPSAIRNSQFANASLPPHPASLLPCPSALLLSCFSILLLPATVFWSVLLPVWSLVMLRMGPVALFAPPPRVSLETSLPNPTRIRFGESIVLRGYRARITQPGVLCTLSHTCDPALEVTLFWQAAHPITTPWALALQLVSPVPGETELRLNYNHWPGHGNLPTSAWPANVLLKDIYRLPLTTYTAPTRAWALQLAFFDPATEARLPVVVDDTPVGDAARLELLRVPGIPIPLPDWPTSDIGSHIDMPVVFGNSIFLRDAQVEADLDTGQVTLAGQEGLAWQVSLVWECQAAPESDYTVFVHAYDAAGNLLAAGDAPPLNGGFPTHLWQRGDRILDTYTLLLPAGATPARIAAGLYSPVTGERLPALTNGTPVPDHAATLWTNE